MSNADTTTLAKVAAIRPPAPYVGGKRALARCITQRLAMIPHTLYAEPFVGMGGIFFRRQARPRCEVINDLNTDVTTLFRILQRHYQSFLDELKWRLCSRAEFNRLVAANPDTLTDLERAARFLYLQRAGFGGKVVGQNFGIDYQAGARFNLMKLVPILEDVHERLAGVIIECLPYADFLARYDRAGTLFYVDPPYAGTEHYYGADLFGAADHTRLARTLRDLKGQWLLSINDTAEIRQLYAGCTINSVTLNYGLAGGARSAQELLISPPG